ncbi:hypothetical protein CEXT_466241 [Caerostris extrusa]|uniref:Uncharacterized protein n=1 Tax=Caerostris extrusa TaxID=172846 RepID=A0AAV4WWD3_CAEEX|nr:hypothetical protein CEXT_466241 [Caerostris extrusa]
MRAEFLWDFPHPQMAVLVHFLPCCFLIPVAIPEIFSVVNDFLPKGQQYLPAAVPIMVERSKVEDSKRGRVAESFVRVPVSWGYSVRSPPFKPSALPYFFHPLPAAP